MTLGAADGMKKPLARHIHTGGVEACVVRRCLPGACGVFPSGHFFWPGMALCRDRMDAKERRLWFHPAKLVDHPSVCYLVHMTILQLKLELPDALASEAQAAGLLEPQAIQSLLSEAIRQRRIAKLMEARERIAAAGIPPMTMEEIQAEIDAERKERYGRNKT